MKLKDCREAYESSSGKASDLVRYLGFAGIALIWVFKMDRGGVPVLSSELYLPAALIAAGLTADLLQYVAHGVTYWVVFRCKEKDPNTTVETDFTTSKWLPLPFWVLWCLKLILVIVAYVLILVYLCQRVFGTCPISTLR